MANKGIENLIKDALAADCRVIRKALHFEVSKPSDRVTVLCICPDEVAPPDRGR